MNVFDYAITEAWKKMTTGLQSMFWTGGIMGYAIISNTQRGRDALSNHHGPVSPISLIVDSGWNLPAS